MEDVETAQGGGSTLTFKQRMLESVGDMQVRIAVVKERVAEAMPSAVKEGFAGTQQALGEASRRVENALESVARAGI